MKKIMLLATFFLCAMLPLTAQATIMENADYVYIISNGECTLIEYLGGAKYLTIPAEIDGCRVTTIGAECFKHNHSIISVTMPDTIVSIEAKAFAYTNIRYVELSDRLESIGGWAFASCDNITSIELPESLTTIGENVFRATGLQKISIPGGVANITQSAFYGCKSLQVVTLEEGVETIGANVFAKCENLVTVSVPQSLRSIGVSAFDDCSRLSYIELPLGVEYKDQSAYWPSFPSHTQIVLVPITPTTPVLGMQVQVSDSGARITIPEDSVMINDHIWSIPITNADPLYISFLKLDAPYSDATFSSDGYSVSHSIHEGVPVQVAKKKQKGAYGVYIQYVWDSYAYDICSWAMTEKQLDVFRQIGYTLTFNSQGQNPSESRIPGDANADGSVDNVDALVILRYVAGENVTINSVNADVNGDSAVDIYDALRIFQREAGWNVSLQ